MRHGSTAFFVFARFRFQHCSSFVNLYPDGWTCTVQRRASVCQLSMRVECGYRRPYDRNQCADRFLWDRFAADFRQVQRLSGEIEDCRAEIARAERRIALIAALLAVDVKHVELPRGLDAPVASRLASLLGRQS